MGIEEIVVAGKILYLNVCFPHEIESHNKYLVFAGVDETPLLLKINTKEVITTTSKRFGEYQFKFRQAAYPFLKYDSHIDCGTVWYNLVTMEEIQKQLSKDPARIMGDVQENHKNEIVKFVNMSKSISRKHKEIISKAMSNKDPA